RCAALGLDKVLMKGFLERADVPTLPWMAAGASDAQRRAFEEHGEAVVVKDRFGTEGKGQLLVERGALAIDPTVYHERYCDGDEYSVNVVVEDGYWATLPVVWKGPTRRDLLPPYKRLRVCPAPMVSPALDHAMRECALRIARLAACSGMMEVEFLVADETTWYVLEINPRVAGTMRMAALAAQVPLFRLPIDRSPAGHLQATQLAVEVPHAGQSFSDPTNGIFCTSRLTVGAQTLGAIAVKLERLEAEGMVLWPSWRDAIQALARSAE
ncbi:MAG TPA: ATP-grasp domain-containing protein, partial [Gemmatimonadaceae bacterium]